MGLLKKLFGGGTDERVAETRDEELQAFLHHGEAPPGEEPFGEDGGALSPERSNANDKNAVANEDVAGAYGSAVVARTVPMEDEQVVQVDLRLESGDDVSVYVCNHSELPGMAVEDEAAWRDSGVERELPGVGDSAFVNTEGTVFARLGDRYTVQILAGAGPTDEKISQGRTLARSILARLDEM